MRRHRWTPEGKPNWQPSRDLANKLRRRELHPHHEFLEGRRLRDLVDYVKADGYNADDADVGTVDGGGGPS